MPIASDPIFENHALPGGFGFTAVTNASLGASEYTLAELIMDESGSTKPFSDKLAEVARSVVRMCRLSPIADNLMYRVTAFANTLREIHGFKLLADCNEGDYDNCFRFGGGTSLFDASRNGIDAMTAYAASLRAAEYDKVNGVVFIITDGMDNGSAWKAKHVRESLEKCVSSETIESLMTFLIGVNIFESDVIKALQDYQDEVQFNHYIRLENASDQNMAKLANFVSQSVSATRKSLGTGAAAPGLSRPINTLPQNITF